MKGLWVKVGAHDKRKGYVTLDIDERYSPDICADIRRTKLKTNSVEKMRIECVLTHTDLFEALREIYRICRNGATIDLWFPHFSGHHVWTDIQHRRGGSYFMFDSIKDYGMNFSVIHRRILVEGRGYTEKTGKTRWHYPMMFFEFLANISPRAFERLWCYWIGGAEGLYFKLKVVK